MLPVPLCDRTPWAPSLRALHAEQAQRVQVRAQEQVQALVLGVLPGLQRLLMRD